MTTLTLADGRTIAVHPAADLFPMMSDAKLRELGEDIRKHGLKQPLVFYADERRRDRQRESVAYIQQSERVDGKQRRGELPLLDGRNRLMAMDAAGLLAEPGLTVLFNEAKTFWGRPEDLVVSNNIRRRHLTAEQYDDLVAELIKANPAQSDRAIAKLVDRSPTTVGKMRAKLEKTGDVSKLDTRTDTKGRQQPAHKKTVTIEVTTTPIELRGAALSEDGVRRIDEAAAAANRRAAPAALSDADRRAAFAQVSKVCGMVARQLRGMQAAVLLMPLTDRVSAAAELLDALGITVDDLLRASPRKASPRLDPDPAPGRIRH